jgi:hypothetical protein
MIVSRPPRRGLPESIAPAEGFWWMVSDAVAQASCSAPQNFLALGEAFASQQRAFDKSLKLPWKAEIVCCTLMAHSEEDERGRRACH